MFFIALAVQQFKRQEGVWRGENANLKAYTPYCYEKLLRDSIIRVYANLVQKLREYLISLYHGD